MFRQLAAATGNSDAVLTQHRPSELSEFLEAFWVQARNPVRQAAMGPNVTATPHQQMARSQFIDPLNASPQVPATRHGVWWHHLIYAYMLENTRMVDIFRRVVFEWVTGERLPVPSQLTQRWLHVTEQLFFAPPWPYSVRAVTSTIRPDHGAVRRNAYYRLLGMDLNHGTEDGGAYPFVKSDVANRDFASIFEALLAEVWRAYTNRLTSVAENLTDEEAIRNLVRRLREMLLSRRSGGLLSREEFDAVAMLSWFHLTVESNNAVINDLSAGAEGVADRLMRVGERVGLPAHARSDAYFQLADPMSNVLLTIEGLATLAPKDLYVPGELLTADMLTIITHWSVATGRNIKDPTTRQPISTVLRQVAPSPVFVPPGGGNGGGNGGVPGGRLGSLVR